MNTPLKLAGNLIWETLQKCEECPLHESANRIVLGNGPTPADVMLVGEAPGAQEDDIGIPFAGASGAKLDILLEQARLERADVYVTNLVKHRPPRNRNPYKREINACAHWLEDELNLVRPLIVITLGAVAGKYFKPDLALTREHGVSHEAEGFLLVTMYHPAAALHNPNLWPIQLEDWASLRSRLYDKKITPRTDYRLHGSLTPSGPIGFDLETTSPTRGGRFAVQEADVVGYSWASVPGKASYIPEKPYKIKTLLEDEGQEVVCHNAKFEYTHLRNNDITLANFHDTKLAAYLLGLPSTHLKDLAVQELGIKPITYTEVTGGKDMSELSAEEILPYAAADADNTLQLWPILYNRMKELELDNVYNDIELPLVPVLSDMERRGVVVSMEATEEAIAFFKDEQDKAECKAHEVIPDDVNIGSSDQLARWLESEGAPITKRTEGKGLLATDENTLRALAGTGWYSDTVSAIMEFKMFRKLGAFPKKFKELSGWDGALHPNFNQGGYYEASSDTCGSAPATGRLSCSTPNLQQIPHHGRGKGARYEEYGKKVRGCLVARPGYLLVAADVGQQEPRIASLVAPEPALQEDFSRGLTPYALIGQDIYERDIVKGVDEQEWHTAKTFFLALVYGAGATKLHQIDPRLSLEQSQKGYDRVRDRYKGLVQFRHKVSYDIWEKGYARDYFGRIRWFPGIYSTAPFQREATLREAINFHIQGPAASCIKIAMRRLWEGIQERGLDAHLLLQVHDEVVLEVKEEELEMTMALVNDMLSDVMPIDFPIESEVGKTWAEMKSL